MFNQDLRGEQISQTKPCMLSAKQGSTCNVTIYTHSMVTSIARLKQGLPRPGSNYLQLGCHYKCYLSELELKQGLPCPGSNHLQLGCQHRRYLSELVMTGEEEGAARCLVGPLFQLLDLTLHAGHRNYDMLYIIYITYNYILH